jgi:hypothetical protein
MPTLGEAAVVQARPTHHHQQRQQQQQQGLHHQQQQQQGMRQQQYAWYGLLDACLSYVGQLQGQETLDAAALSVR